MKIVINYCFGAFELSPQAVELMRARGYDPGNRGTAARYGDRTHPVLVSVVEELGAEADGRFAELGVVEIPDGTGFTIERFRGSERVRPDRRVPDQRVPAL
jgi:hypothetical protein